jgi:hypothetical protein
MLITDNAGNLMNVGGLGSRSPSTDSNVMLSPTATLPAVQFRTGNAVFGQLIGASANNAINSDASGGVWRWRSVLNDDNNTQMLLNSTGLTVTGKVAAVSAAVSSSGTVLEPFSSAQATTNGVQIGIGVSGSWRATFGTRYSQGEAFMVHNARQTASVTDQWQQTTPAGSTWDSLGLFLRGNPSVTSLGGFHLKRAAAGTANNVFASFWSDIFTVGLNGDVTTFGASVLLNNGTSNLIQFGPVGDGAPSFTTRSVGTKLVLYPSLSGSQVDYGLGMYSGALWMSVATTSSVFRWYGGTTEMMSLTGTGLSFYGGTVYMGNASSNLLSFNSAGTAAPAFTTRSVGTKIVLYPAISGSAVDYGLGIEANTLWFSTTTATSNFKWYGGTTLLMSLMGENVVLGSSALGTTATDGFLYIRTVSGAPTGTPTSFSGRVALVYDTANNHFYIYNGAWKKVALT